MPTPVETEDDIKPGEIYEDTFYHPCLCMGIEHRAVWGISLIDGSFPRSADIGMSGVRKLTLEEAWHWKSHGPADVELEPNSIWWK